MKMTTDLQLVPRSRKQKRPKNIYVAAMATGTEDESIKHIFLKLF
jgi:hypothetical protein